MLNGYNWFLYRLDAGLDFLLHVTTSKLLMKVIIKYIANFKIPHIT